ncbi:hypothetical protein C8234_10365 [Paracidovorax avenae]|uniref:hypothetical protein n=1 Tax=Paracidovorax avenae TaxID=80867 RepID=UPI000D21A232|nr:hypothetical protein [Paracidovorax avenae]AVS78432.1 hypothetical protein C8234_10365 [Paracidovorax avenae]
MKKHDTDTSKKRLFISLAALAIFATAPLPQAQAAVIGSVQVDATFRSNGQPKEGLHNTRMSVQMR